MKIAVFGVTHWDDEVGAATQEPVISEWERRVRAFIPQCTQIFLSTGSYSPPEFCPIDVPVVQAEMYRGAPYSMRNNYFHYGFKTGIWKKVLDNDFDLLIHCQTTRFLGEDMTNHITEFMNRDELLMAPRFSSLIGSSIDVGFMCMKKQAALYYTATGRRQSFSLDEINLNCEEEAYMMFNGSWYNPWLDIPTIRQLDISYCRDDIGIVYNSPFTITDIDKFRSLPLIANGKHVTDEFLEEWKLAHPIPNT